MTGQPTGRLSGEVAVVTGSTAGLGAEIARLFAEQGAATVVTGRNEQRGEDLVGEITASGGQAAFIRCDLGVAHQRAELIRRTDALFGPVSALVNNAVNPSAIAADGSVVDLEEATWHEMLQVNVVAAAEMCKLVIPAMLDRGRGAIVNVSSRAAERSSRGLAAYTASKGALNALTRSISTDFAHLGVRCNTVQPGYVLNDARDHGDETTLRRVRAMHLTRLPSGRDVVYAVLFMASSESEVISGVTLPVDGGSSAARGLTLG